MKLTKEETNWIKKNRVMIGRILSKRLEMLKDRLLETEPEQRDKTIEWIKEYKDGLGYLKEITYDKKKKEDFTGI